MGMSTPDCANGHPRSSSSFFEREAARAESITQPISSPDASVTSFDDNGINAFGPIQVKTRRKPAPTLATGRRSKYEILTPEEERKRDVRRARNRAAAERVRLSRLEIENELQRQLHDLEEQERQLLLGVEGLQQQKLDLQTRIQTHRAACSSSDYSSIFPTDNAITTSSTSQSVNQMADLYLNELVLFPPSTTQIQQDLFSDAFPAPMPDDEVDDFFRNL